MVRGAEVALAAIVETDAVLLWPARLAWVGPETVTSLIERHGPEERSILRPTWEDEPGWPTLVPIAALAALRAVPSDDLPSDVLDGLAGAGFPVADVPLGDPGVALDIATARRDLPSYVGPIEPPAGHVHEWGAPLADAAEDVPLEGPALAPYAPAGIEGADEP
jgi:CTP:molybdopterin cytidylyltransferase MocA